MTESAENVLRERENTICLSHPQLGVVTVSNAYKQRGSVALGVPTGSRGGAPSPEELRCTGIRGGTILQRKRGPVPELLDLPEAENPYTPAAIIDSINNNRDAHVITWQDPIEHPASA